MARRDKLVSVDCFVCPWRAPATSTPLDQTIERCAVLQRSVIFRIAALLIATSCTLPNTYLCA
jgi:hypothetical protein